MLILLILTKTAEPKWWTCPKRRTPCARLLRQASACQCRDLRAYKNRRHEKGRCAQCRAGRRDHGRKAHVGHYSDVPTPIMISGVDIDISLCEERHSVEIVATTKCTGATGVEMEALTAVSVAALTVYDMCKAVQRDIEITDIRLLKKTGGKSGVFERKGKEYSDRNRRHDSVADKRQRAFAAARPR